MNCRRIQRAATAGSVALWMLAALLLAGMTCPCEAPPPVECAAAAGHTDCCSPAADPLDESTPADDSCADDCPRCICCIGLVTALLPATSDCPPVRHSVDAPADSYRTPACGHPAEIFKPPRSLA